MPEYGEKLTAMQREELRERIERLSLDGYGVRQIALSEKVSTDTVQNILTERRLLRRTLCTCEKRWRARSRSCRPCSTRNWPNEASSSRRARISHGDRTRHFEALDLAKVSQVPLDANIWLGVDHPLDLDRPTVVEGEIVRTEVGGAMRSAYEAEEQSGGDKQDFDYGEVDREAGRAGRCH